MAGHDPDAIIADVLSRFKQDPIKRGMARATLVLDEGVSILESSLKEANFLVVVPRKGMADFETKKALLSHRVLVTDSTKDFLDDAPVLDYGIIGIEALRFVDSSPIYRENHTAQLISKAVSEFNLISMRSGFVLMLKDDGGHHFKRID